MQEEVLSILEKYIDVQKRDFFPKFFKTEKGDYGEGDKFLGVTVPNCRKVARKYKDISIGDIEQILRSQWHEMRLTALFILVSQFENGDEEKRTELYEFYMEHTTFVNNWDLVDATAYKIMGEYVLTHPEKVLYKFAQSKNIWEKRTAMIATLAFIKQGKLKETYEIADILLHDSHDLVQKAVGWMLREAGAVDEGKLIKFLNKNVSSMPRTTLRYAIEKFPEKVRREYLDS